MLEPLCINHRRCGWCWMSRGSSVCIKGTLFDKTTHSTREELEAMNPPHRLHHTSAYHFQPVQAEDKYLGWLFLRTRHLNSASPRQIEIATIRDWWSIDKIAISDYSCESSRMIRCHPAVKLLDSDNPYTWTMTQFQTGVSQNCARSSIPLAKPIALEIHPWQQWCSLLWFYSVNIPAFESRYRAW
jgi:hypothetical protein